MDELECGICLELFQDPRNLPCLHTFCRECIQRSLNETDHSLKCPVCRAKHELSDEGAGLLPVNQYALQELPLKRLQQQQREDNGGHQDECTSCRKTVTPVVAWCEDCDGMICQLCLSQHKNLTGLQGHVVRAVKKFKECENDSSTSTNETATDVRVVSAKCLRHSGVKLKFVCTHCSELVCSECLLVGTHKDHEYSLVEEARHSLETEMEELVSLVDYKKEEFSEYLVKASKAESEALEYSELMKSEVDNVFDGIVASVEAQRNEALQSVSEEVKEIWAQKEMVEVSLAQLDSFTRFVDHTHKCTNNTSYVAMATQGIKLMERLKDTHGDESALDCEKMIIGSVLPHTLYALDQPSLKFSPRSGSTVHNIDGKVTLTVSLRASRFPVNSQALRERCQLNSEAKQKGKSVPTEVIAVQSGALSWKVSASVSSNRELVVSCWLSGKVTTEQKEASYAITSS